MSLPCCQVTTSCLCACVTKQYNLVPLKAGS